MEPEIYENRSLPYFFIIKNTTKFQKHFFLDFPAFREARTLKIKPNHCRVDQKRGYQRFLEKRNIFKIISKSDPPIDPLKPIISEKSPSGLRQKNTLKKQRKNREETGKPEPEKPVKSYAPQPGAPPSLKLPPYLTSLGALAAL